MMPHFSWSPAQIVGRTPRSVRMGLRPTDSDENQLEGGQFCPQPAFSRLPAAWKGACGQDWPPSNFNSLRWVFDRARVLQDPLIGADVDVGPQDWSPAPQLMQEARA
jgi:hypothetical protein